MMIGLDKIPRTTAPMQVVNAIRDAIASGNLKVGDKLPPESELATRLGVGRSSFREGMRILATYGVVEIRQGEGTFIVNHMAERFMEFLGFLPESQNLYYMIELRRILEVGSIMELCGKVADEQIQELRSVNQKLVSSNDYAECADLDIEFHRLLISYNKNPMLDQFNEMITKMRKELLHILFYRLEETALAASAHEKIVNALALGNVTACVSAVQEHLSATERSMKLVI